VHSYVGDSYRGADRGSRHQNGWSWKFSDIDLQLRHLRAAHRDGYRVSAGIARLGTEPRLILVLVVRVTIVVGSG
jgi:hypothetical protein